MDLHICKVSHCITTFLNDTHDSVQNNNTTEESTSPPSCTQRSQTTVADNNNEADWLISAAGHKLLVDLCSRLVSDWSNYLPRLLVASADNFEEF